MSTATTRAGSLRGLYAITADALCADPALLLPAVAAAIRGGARLIQYRDKVSPPSRRLQLAHDLTRLCRGQGAALIVNDDVALAQECGADGVHLGAGDPPLAAARAALGPEAIIGASCGPRLERALAAEAAGASYVAFGRFFPSLTKPDAPQAGIELLGEARVCLQVPICAIGGISVALAGTVHAAGADLIAAIEGVFGDPRPFAVEAAARAYRRVLA